MGNNSLGSLKVCQSILDIFTTSFANPDGTNGRIILNGDTRPKETTSRLKSNVLFAIIFENRYMAPDNCDKWHVWQQ